MRAGGMAAGVRGGAYSVCSVVSFPTAEGSVTLAVEDESAVDRPMNVRSEVRFARADGSVGVSRDCEVRFLDIAGRGGRGPSSEGRAARARVRTAPGQGRVGLGSCSAYSPTTAPLAVSQITPVHWQLSTRFWKAVVHNPHEASS